MTADRTVRGPGLYRAADDPNRVPSFWETLEGRLYGSSIPSLDGLRAIAVFLVILYHSGLHTPGGLGVLAFFVLSGFLITWLLLRENERFGTISLRKFYARRALRIFPAFYFYWFAMVILLCLMGKHIRWDQTIFAFFFLTNYYNAICGDPNTFLSHTWSLGVEEQFYLLWPGVFLLLRRDLRRMAKVLAGVVLLIWTYRLSLVLVFGVSQGYIYEAFDTRADHLLIGCLLAVLLKLRIGSRLWSALCSNRLLPLVPLLALGLSSYFETEQYRDTVGFILHPVLVVLLIVQLIYFSPSCPWRCFNWSWVGYLGRISYSLYLWQQVTVGVGQRLAGGMPPVIQVLSGVLLTVLIASASFFLIERAFLRLKTRFQPLSTVDR